MPIVVLKFGGTSVGNIERIKASAEIIAREVQKGFKVIAVVSAMAGKTDDLVSLTKKISPSIYGSKLPEYDTVISAGEQVSSGLMALALISIGIPAKSWQAWQIPVITNNYYSSAKIQSIEIPYLHESLVKGEVAIVSGFQGINKNNRITTLGRGGSDTTAVALAAAFNAIKCNIYTDVDGVYTADPRVIPKANKIHSIDYEEMIEMASLGSKVLHPRCVAIAYNHGVKINVLSSFLDKEGTIVQDNKDIERNNVAGISVLSNECLYKINFNEKQVTSLLNKVINLLNQSNIIFDMLSFNDNSVTFTTNSDNEDTIAKIIDSAGNIEVDSMNIISGLAKISIIGSGIKSNPDILAAILNVCTEKSVAIFLISTSEIKISFIIKKEYTELIVNNLHNAFELDKERL